MDLTKACNILEISFPFSLHQLKKTYYKAALKYHPDRNPDLNSKEKFQEIKLAFDTLKALLEIEEETVCDDTYESLFKKFIQTHAGITINSSFFQNVISDCQKISIKAFEGIDKHSALKIFGYLQQYSDLLKINKDVLDSIRNIIKKKMQNDELIILNSTITHLINREVYVLNHNSTIYYIPLWHDELTYDNSGSSLIVKCIPELPEYITLDNNNSLHVNVRTSISNLLDKDTLNIDIGQKVFKIPINELKIKNKQIYIFKKEGIPIINTQDIYNDATQGDIIVHIEFK